MKQIIFTAFLICTFCFATFAQAVENQSKATKISEYWEDPSSENGKFSVYDLYKELQKSPNTEGIIKIQAKESGTIIQQLRKVKSFVTFLNADLTRFSFAINNSNEKIIQYWFVPLTENIPDCKNCIIIRAEDYDKLADFFHPKPKPRRRKK